MKKPEKKEHIVLPFNLWMEHISIQLEKDRKKLGMLPNRKHNSK
jgi:hypothetical protein